MVFKTLIFILLLFFLIKFIGRLFLPPSGEKRHTIRVFYRVFKNLQEQQRRQEQQQSRSSHKKNRFEEIEEAEYEDVTEKKS